MTSWAGTYISNGVLMQPRWTVWGWIHEPVLPKPPGSVPPEEA